MASQQSLRVILDLPSTGAWNMAVDQALLQFVESEAVPVVRVYGWLPATLSLGYFQQYEDRQQHGASVNCAAVRRSSGGGAILHHHETTYSLCIPSTNRWAARNTEVYTTVHDCISAALAEWDVIVEAHSDDENQRSATGNSPFLCFLRRSSGDLILHRKKVVGSAQRRSRNALLQHGSVLWEQSEFAPDLLGINDLAGLSVDREQFVESFVTRLAQELGVTMYRDNLNDGEVAEAHKIVETKFGTEAWNRHRNRNTI